MSTHQNKKRTLQELQLPQVTPAAHGSDAAPVVFFDAAVAYGTSGAVGRVELAVACTVPVTDRGRPGARQRVLVTCHLRGSLEAMAQLADAIGKMLAIGKPSAAPATVEDTEGGQDA